MHSASSEQCTQERGGGGGGGGGEEKRKKKINFQESYRLSLVQCFLYFMSIIMQQTNNIENKHNTSIIAIFKYFLYCQNHKSYE